jgi:protoheme IX farnesyltransferase
VIRTLARLYRPRLSLLNAVSSLGGYLLYPEEIEWLRLLAAFFGVLLLAAAASALNQVLEPDLDRLMERTRQRPLPSGQLTTKAASLHGGGCLLAGLLLLETAGGLGTMLLGALTLFLYLALYTPLKRRSSWALALGAVCGALPPVIGWSAAGGDPLDFRVVLLAGLLYLWQIPHFWLFQRRHAEDYRRAGIPSVAAGLDAGITTCLFRLWIVALVAAAMLLPAFGIVGQTAGFWYAVFLLPLLLIPLKFSEKGLFSYLNLFPLLVTLSFFSKGVC